MDIYTKYGLQKVINASGKMTALGVSKADQTVVDDVNFGLKNFFIMDELNTKANKYIAELLGVEAACIVASASAGIAMSIASLIAKSDLVKTELVHQLPTQKRNVLIYKGHNVHYGGNIETMINLGGGRVVEVGNANLTTAEHVQSKINENTLCLLYVKSHHCVQKNQLELVELLKIGKEFNVPVIVDAAAEEDLKLYYDLGADIVIYSGGKALCGPTSGLVLGKQQYIKDIYFQYRGIGRAMKIGKEGILGLTRAVENYAEKTSDLPKQKELVDQIINDTKTSPNLKLSEVFDTAGREIVRVLLTTTPANAKQIIEFLRKGEYAVETRNHQANLGMIEFDVRSLTTDEVTIICNKLNEYMELECK
ncbi:MAG: DgaE family pyridoxal phosphate-dependent ammonia lyase [Mycoplasmatales bacterium]